MSKHSHNQGNTAASDSGGSQGPAGSQEPRNAQEGAAEAQGKPSEKPVEIAEKVQEGQVPETVESLEAKLADRELKIADLETKLAELNDQYLRKAADFENFRKRVIREKQELSEFANQNLLLDILPIIDDFERAIKSAETSKDFASFYEGIAMIEKRFSTDLENKWGLKRFESVGQPFDPNRHDAIQVEKVAGAAGAVVKEVFVKGYLLKERVIRCAKVKVLMPENEEQMPNDK